MLKVNKLLAVSLMMVFYGCYEENVPSGENAELNFQIYGDSVISDGIWLGLCDVEKYIVNQNLAKSHTKATLTSNPDNKYYAISCLKEQIFISGIDSIVIKLDSQHTLLATPFKRDRNLISITFYSLDSIAMDGNTYSSRTFIDAFERMVLFDKNYTVKINPVRQSEYSEYLGLLSIIDQLTNEKLDEFSMVRHGSVYAELMQNERDAIDNAFSVRVFESLCICK